MPYRLVKMTQEVGKVEAVEGSLDLSLYPIGSLLEIVPYHVSVVVVELLGNLSKRQRQRHLRQH